MNNLVGSVEKSIVQKQLLERGQRLLVAVSGGLDSMVLLRLLDQLSVRYAWRLVVAHYNHQLRGVSSDADERFVKGTAAKLELDFLVGRGDVRAFQRRNRLSLEMAARKMRHDWLAATAKQLAIDTIALAHHADDQIELFFLRLFRGSGTAALSGMGWAGPSPTDSRIRLVRPLLGQSKSDLQAFAQMNRIAFRQDATNELLDIQRNRVRHELVPLLLRDYQPALLRTTLRVMEILRAEADYINQVSRDWLRRKGRLGFDRLPIAIQRHCLHARLVELEIEPDFELIERLRRAPGKRISLEPGLTIVRDETGEIQLRKNDSCRFNPNQIVVDLSAGQGSISFQNMELSWEIASYCQSRRPNRPSRPSRGCERFDADKVGASIVLRHWKPGDRFHPIGLKGPVKLQDLFVNQKIARPERHKIVVAATMENEIFWVEGLRIGESFKLDKATGRRLKWSWRRQNDSPARSSR